MADVTGFPEMLDGRVKTLHPHIHGGILAMRDNPEHVAVLEKHGIGSIDLVVCNLYPFEATVARPGSTHEEIIENIDIGGPTMVRAAAKNYHDVAVVTDPGQYAAVLEEMQEQPGALALATRERLAAAAFARIAAYDQAIAAYFAWPGRRRRAARPTLDLALAQALATSATARTRTRRPPSTSIRPAATPAWPRPRCCTARSCPTTTSSISTAP